MDQTLDRGLKKADVQTRRRVAQLGGTAVSQNREHMREIGRKGGRIVSQNREHMREIGRRGGRRSRRQPMGSAQEAASVQ